MAGVEQDIISGFCGETEEEHQDTVSLMDQAQYEQVRTHTLSEPTSLEP